MGLALRDGVTFCLVGGRAIFLDVPADRYFCLAAPAERAFLALAEQGGTGATTINRLRASGLVVESREGGGIAPCASPPSATTSVLDTPLPAAGLMTTGRALWQLGRSRSRLRRTGLAPTIARLRARRAKCVGRAALADPEGIESVLVSTVAGFVRAGRMVSVLDTCLVHSLAVAERLASRGVAAHLVVGVRLGPFSAHGWVQHGSRLVNDRIDLVRTFTPILVV